MKFIKTVVLHNYRTHVDSTIELGMLTSFTGENGCGKSNIWRALNMVLTHGPFTEKALHYGTKEGFVRVVFDDDTWIERQRNGSKQKLIIFDGKKPTEYATIKDVGGIVEEFTGFSPVKIDKNATAESVQLIPIHAGQTFMILGVSPEVVQRRIQRLMHGAGVETAKMTLETEHRKLKNTFDTQNADYLRSQKLVDTLELPQWAEAEALLKQCASVRASLQTSIEVGNAVVDARDALPGYERALELEDDMKEVDELLTSLDNVQLRIAETEALDFATRRQSIVDSLAKIEKLESANEQIDTEIEACEAELDELVKKEAQEYAEQQAAIKVQQAAEAAARASKASETTQPPTVATVTAQPPETAPQDNRPRLYVDRDLVLDTVDCLERLKDKDKFAAEIAQDWRVLCQES